MKEVYEMEDLILERLGYEEAWNALVKALKTDELKENYEFIIRCYGLKEGQE